MNMRHSAIWAVGMALLPAGAAAESGVAVPRAAYVRDAVGDLRPLEGVAGTFLLGAPLAGEVRAFASWSEEAVAVLDTRIVLLRNGRPVEESPAPEGRVVVGLDEQGKPRVAVFPEAGAAALRTRQGWEVLPTTLPEGTILAAAAAARGAVLVLAVAREDGLWLVHRLVRRGATLREEWIAPGATAACLAPGGRVVFAAAGRIVVREPSEWRRAASVPGEVEALEPAGRGWIQIRLAGGRSRIARIDAGGVQIFHVPEAVP